MIRLEVKVIIPNHRKKEEFLKLLVDSAAEENDSFLWETSFDIIEGTRASLEAVVGKSGFPFLEGKLLVLTFDFISRQSSQKICKFFQRFAISWEIEITELSGERVYGDIVDPDELFE